MTEVCPYTVSLDLPVILRAQDYGQQMVSQPEKHESLWAELEDWSESVYRCLLARGDPNTDETRHKIMRLTRYAGLVAFYSVADMSISRAVSDLEFGALTTKDLDMATGLDSPYIDYKTPQTNIFSKRFTTVVEPTNELLAFRMSWLRRSDYWSLAESLKKLQPQFAESRKKLYNYYEPDNFEGYIESGSWDNGLEIMKALLACAMAAGSSDPEILAAHALGNIDIMAAMASVDRKTGNGDLEGDKRADGSVAQRDRELPLRAIVNEYQRAVLEGRPLSSEFGYFIVRNGILVDRRPALQAGPFNPPRYCPGYALLRGPDGVERRPVETALRLGIIIAKDTIYNDWPGVI